MTEEKAEPRVPVQFRIGEGMLARLQHAVESSGQSRTGWVREACHDLLETGKPLRVKLTAAELLANRVTLMVRLEPFLVEMIDEACEERGVSRTVWILDACLTKMRQNGARRG